MRKRFAFVAGASSGGILALNLVLFAGHWSGAASFPWDFPRGYYASTAYWIAAFEAGEWPQWMPYQSMGYPFALNTQTGAFYPPFWAFPLLDLPYTLRAANVVQALHVAFGAFGMLLFVHRWLASPAIACVGAVAFHLFGGFFTNSEHPDIVRSFAFLPWILWTVLPPASATRLPPGIAGLTLANLCLPLLVAAFVAGSYPGSIIAAGLAVGAFALTRAIVDSRRGDTRGAVARPALAGLGVMLACGYWLPVVSMSGELVRPELAAGLERRYLRASDVLQLLYPSSAFDTRDWSMYGSQLPIVLVPFLIFLTWRDWRRHVPLLAAAAVAILLGSAELVPVSRAITAWLSPLGWSRFPAGDYRIFVYFAVLLLCLSGLENVRRKDRIGVAELVGMGAATLALIGISIWFWHAGTLPESRALYGRVFVWQASGLLASCGALWLLRNPGLRIFYVAGAVPLLSILVMVPVLHDMKSAWRHDGLGEILYPAEPPVSEVFRRVLRERPARRSAEASGEHRWQGYLDGTFLIADKGNTVTRARHAIESDPALAAFMMQPSRTIVVPCGTIDCDRAELDGIDVRAGAPALRFEPIHYGRDEVAYDVTLAARSLLVENETFAPGWQGAVDPGGMALEPVRVDGALRGWVLPEGTHRLRLRYRTPKLAAGLAVSAGAFLAWLVLLLAWTRGGRRARAAAAVRRTPGE